MGLFVTSNVALHLTIFIFWRVGMKKLLIVLAVVSLLVAPAFAAKSNSFEKAVKGEGVDWATQTAICNI